MDTMNERVASDAIMPFTSDAKTIGEVGRAAVPPAMVSFLAVAGVIFLGAMIGCRSAQPPQSAMAVANSPAGVDGQQPPQLAGEAGRTPAANGVSQASAVDPVTGKLKAESPQVVTQANLTGESPATTTGPSASVQTVSAPVPGEQTIDRQQAMAQLQDDLRAIEAIDPMAEQRLLANLQSARPDQWALMVEQFRSALTYKQQLAVRDARLASRSEPKAATADTPVVTATDQAAPQSTQANATEDRTQAEQPSSSSPSAGTPTNIQLVSTGAEGQVTPESISRDPPAAQVASPSSATVPLAPPPLQATAGQSKDTDGPIVGSPDALEQAIASLEQSVADVPVSTEEIHQHMRLRMLYLLAGRQEDAFQPIPGATPVQQDFWSKQLFAMATYLDNQTQPDSKRRSAAALAHLDEARGKLSELATLQIRNLEFVSSVDGYGAYEPLKQTSFQPGEQVILYAEVENYRSESTETGYVTSLSTSYQVVDNNGKRVDGGQFPDVVDRCKNRRRDFHIQYGIALPTRIYPESYRLELIVTDNQSGKIGQATLPFTIVE